MRANPLFTAIAATAVAFGLVIGAASTTPAEPAAQGAIVRTVGSPDAADAHALPAVATAADAETGRGL